MGHGSVWRCLGVVSLLLLSLGEASAFWGDKIPRQGEAGWRTDGTGRYPDATPPTSWSISQNVVWKRPLQNWSNATPVLHKGRIFVCEEPSTLVCIDQKSGEELWRAAVPYEELSAPADSGGKDALVARQRQLQTAINDLSGRLQAKPGDQDLDRELGAARKDLNGVLAEIQRLNKAARQTGLPPTHGTNGYSSPTPVAGGERVFVIFGTGAAAAFDLKGARQWARIAGRPTHGWGHSASPLLVDGKLIVHFDRTVYALDPATGAELWTAASASSWGTPAAMSADGRWAVLTTGGDLIRCDDGRVLAKNVGSMPWTSPLVEKGVIYIVDQNGAAAFTVPAKFDDTVSLEKRWSAPVPADRYYASPVVHEGLLYAMTQSGNMSVLDTATGAVVYQKQLSLGGTTYPSFCVAGGKIFASADTGKTIVLEPGRAYLEAAVNTFEPFRSTPVFSGSRMYIRGLQHLYCLGTPK